MRINVSAHERREWNRYPCDLKTLCQPARADLKERRPARICDISCGGVNLVGAHCFPTGTALSLRVDGADDRAPRSLAAEVVYASRRPDGRWAMGCRLVRLMSERELARLLSLYQGEPDTDEPLVVDGAAPSCRPSR